MLKSLFFYNMGIDKSIVNLVQAALNEDIGPGDLTSRACLEPNPAKAVIIAKQDGILSGLKPALLVFHIVDSANTIKPLFKDGDNFEKGNRILEIDGFNLTLMASERVALNFLAHLSGIATLTNKFVQKIKGTNCRILDTRKTTPGWRMLEKEAVVHGGGENHRYGLYDMILVKDNHIASAGSITKALNQIQEYLHGDEYRECFKLNPDQIKIEVEISTEDQLVEVLKCKADRIMLDNQSIESLNKLVTRAREINPEIELEASGNVSLENVAGIAATGVDYISIGALTHSAPVVDLSMKIIE